MIPAKFEMLESFLATKPRSYIHLADMMVTQRFLPKKMKQISREIPPMLPLFKIRVYTVHLDLRSEALLSLISWLVGSFNSESN